MSRKYNGSKERWKVHASINLAKLNITTNNDRDTKSFKDFENIKDSNCNLSFVKGLHQNKIGSFV